jgi:TrpR-related protein YerC/YecD
MKEISLEEAFVALDTKAITKDFLEDLFSPKEYESLRERWRVVQLLRKGLPYRDISEKTGVSTATVTRVARCLARKKSGYSQLLAKFTS